MGVNIISVLLVIITSVYADFTKLIPKLDTDFPTGVKIINAKDNFSLKCLSPYEAEWNIHGRIRMKPTYYNFTTLDALYPYGIGMTIQGAKSQHTGFYTCQVKKSSKMKAEMYLYVRDEKKLAIQRSSYFIKGILGDSVFIPCKPTSPEFNVLLLLNGKDVISSRKYPVSYDPRTGYLFQNLTQQDNNTYYKCEITFNKAFVNKTFSLTVIDPHKESDTPIIRIIEGELKRNKTHVSVGLGTNFSLDCFTELHMSVSYVLEWESPNLLAQNVRINEFGDENGSSDNDNYESENNNTDINDNRSSMGLQVRKDYDTRKHSTNITLNATNVSKHDEGKYECILTLHPEVYPKPIQSFINIAVIDVSSPIIFDNNKINNTEVILTMDMNFEIVCTASGIPDPVISWFKNNKVLEASSRVLFRNKNQILNLNNVGKDTVGHYFCKASNQIGHKILIFQIAIKEDKTTLIVSLIAVFIISIIIAIVLATMARRIKKERELRNELSFSWLKSFEDGAIGNINPDLGVEEQAELLPYDPVWEFERDKLKLGHQLGSGEFGVVMKGEAIGIEDSESITTVAVKMVRKNAEASHVKALATELKIMSHLGKHLNVVNLLGACTKHLAKRELLVIVEYCKYGNLQGILLRHRHVFVNQLIDDEIQVTEKYKPDYLENIVRPAIKYSAISWRKDQICVDPLPENTRPSISSSQSVSSSNYQWSSGNTEVSDFSDQSSEYTKMDSSVVFRNGKYETEDKTIQAIRSQDLLCWGFQIARGMDYLASRKVLHGDLAARNILLAEDNVVKICDFGLARSVYKNENYYKTENTPLPVKWMAIESIQDHVFSIQSDIWSFGVVLWELFSLAKSPYPGIPVDQTFIEKLISGYRMEKPKYASTAVYEIMQECWQEEPGQRPPFSQIEEKLGDMLENSVKCHYIDKNTEYIVMNTTRETQLDYLTMMSAPTYCNEIVKQNTQESQEPNYINLTSDVAIMVMDETVEENVTEKVNENDEENVDDGYLSMSTRATEPNIVILAPNPVEMQPVDNLPQNNVDNYQNAYQILS